MVRVMNLQKTSEGSCGSSFLGLTPGRSGNEGGTGLRKISREINLVYKGLIKGLEYE